ncbi:MAG: winged helix-turn-helix transcriptional regulator [Candidatus Pacearchaeota archaeon]
MNKNDKLRPIILTFSIITFFIFIISFIVFYATENFSPVCGCRLPLWFIVVSTASLGLFVGLITYYIFSNNFMKERIEKNYLKILDFLDEENREILKLIIKNNGEINQSYLTKSIGINKVKVSRIVSKMIKKGILQKEKRGMTNKLILNKDLKEFFIKQ